MNTVKMISLAIAVTVSTVSMANASTTYSFKGNSEAASICRNIVSDDSTKVSASIKRIINADRVKSFYLKRSAAVLDDFSCNNQSLMDFANQTKAYDVARYLAEYDTRRSTVYVEDVVSN